MSAGQIEDGQAIWEVVFHPGRQPWGRLFIFFDSDSKQSFCLLQRWCCNLPRSFEPVFLHSFEVFPSLE